MLNLLRGVSGRRSQGGFTLIELMVVVVMVSVLGAIATPGWFGYLNRRQVVSAQETIYQAIRQAQAKAQQNSDIWQFSIRERADGLVEWSIHPRAVAPTLWESLSTDSVRIDLDDTTLDSSGGIYYIRFDHKGNLASRTRTLAFSSRLSTKTKRCIIASTLLGELRQGREQATPNASGRSCY
jgi:prepilin-type N-terminal cleavage/methylation domain-containing protein